jgi:hypothetical protein
MSHPPQTSVNAPEKTLCTN